MEFQSSFTKIFMLQLLPAKRIQQRERNHYRIWNKYLVYLYCNIYLSGVS